MTRQSHPLSRLPLTPLLFATLLAVCTSARAADTCTFASVGSAINFPPLDPSVSATLTAFMDVQIKCTNATNVPTWSFSGANGDTPLRMKHATQNAYIPYTVAANNVGGGGSTRTWRVTGTVLGANYQDGLLGTYSDILTATVLP
jgi:hypothetical protein